jgi:hypothetical protein
VIALDSLHELGFRDLHIAWCPLGRAVSQALTIDTSTRTACIETFKSGRLRSREMIALGSQ